MSNKITAPVYKVLETQTFDSGFTKRTLVLKTTGDYPQTIPFDFLKDNVNKLDNIAEGQLVTVSYDLRGNEYKGKFYVNLVGWKIDATEDGNDVTAQAARDKAQPSTIDDVGEDDLPF
jgi:hypothetical protein